MELIIAWVFFAFIVGLVAQVRGRFGFGWFLLSVLFSPILMLILVLVLGRPNEASQEPQDYATASTATHVRCPDCRESVRRDARKCKHCGSALVPQ